MLALLNLVGCIKPELELRLIVFVFWFVFFAKLLSAPIIAQGGM
jgi:hypothetical protein